MSLSTSAVILGRAKRDPRTQGDTLRPKQLGPRLKPEGDNKGLEHSR